MSTQPETSELEEFVGLDGFAAAIDRDAEVPIGLQLGWALCARIHNGEYQPGQRLPGLREMAEASGLNINTVRAVYQRLEQKGLLESQQGSGTFVASTLPRPSAVGTIAADAAREAEAIGVSPREVAAALYVAMPADAPARPAPGSDKDASDEGGVARRRALRVQIATLERAIGEIEAEHPGVAPRPTATRQGPGPTLLSADELEQVRSGLVRRLAAVQTAIDALGSADASEAKEAEETEGRRETQAVVTTGPRATRPRAKTRPAPAGA